MYTENRVDKLAYDYNGYGYDAKLPFNEGLWNYNQLGLRIQPKMKREEFYKAHEYPALLDMVKQINSIEELVFIRRDLSFKLHTDTATMYKVQNIEENGLTIENSSFYEKYKKDWLDIGITSKDIKSFDQWLEDVYGKAIVDRMSEIKGGQV